MTICKPFVRWAGGKSRIVTDLAARIPPAVRQLRHVEPFVGGGALFFALRPGNALLCDANGALVSAYREIRRSPRTLITKLEHYMQDTSAERYLAMRTRFNTEDLGQFEQAAIFLYLMKVGFNGLYRVNSSGEFNVPRGTRREPLQPWEKDRLLDCSDALAGISVLRTDYAECLREHIEVRDFVYLDPPYLSSRKPLKKGHSYTKDGFGLEDHESLLTKLRDLDEDGIAWLLSVPSTEPMRDTYRGYKMERVSCRRSISAKGSSREEALELIISSPALAEAQDRARKAPGGYPEPPF